MRRSQSKWLAYTFFVGLIPVLARLLVWASTTSNSINAFAAPDVIAFGLVLQISIVSELEHRAANEREWKTIHNGTAALPLTLYGALYTLSIISDSVQGTVNGNAVLLISVVLAASSAALSFSVVHRLER